VNVRVACPADGSRLLEFPLRKPPQFGVSGLAQDEAAEQRIADAVIGSVDYAVTIGDGGSRGGTPEVVEPGKVSVMVVAHGNRLDGEAV